MISITKYCEYSSDFLPLDFVVFGVNPLSIFSIFSDVLLMIFEYVESKSSGVWKSNNFVDVL